jgi:hypothetical protein
LSHTHTAPTTDTKYTQQVCCFEDDLSGFEDEHNDMSQHLPQPSATNPAPMARASEHPGLFQLLLMKEVNHDDELVSCLSLCSWLSVCRGPIVSKHITLGLQSTNMRMSSCAESGNGERNFPCASSCSVSRPVDTSGFLYFHAVGQYLLHGPVAAVSISWPDSTKCA